MPGPGRLTQTNTTLSRCHILRHGLPKRGYEPNNAYASYEGPTWQTKLAALTNAVSAAVHAVKPSIQVIGLGTQGTQILNMLAMGNHDEWRSLSSVSVQQFYSRDDLRVANGWSMAAGLPR